MKVRKAVIPAAGLGTRFLPATKALAKEMLPIIDKPTIQYIIEEAKNSGIEDILDRWFIDNCRQLRLWLKKCCQLSINQRSNISLKKLKNLGSRISWS
ncbi:sugar phosphate nucleotidyltransferase [Ligilactobacillus murinus]|uniref:sugar phosphate nucleotidyltransferase n=1 Tax=Ligilactobacillus murinus TaxID=1622 RepID=UPI0035A08271